MKIVLGLSGGVDSAAAAYLLQKAGHTVAGVTLLVKADAPPDIDGAAAVAERLGISHTVLDCTESFRKFVLDDFANCYQRGETPNPCIVCNPNVKFAALMSQMEALGYDGIATGHYANIRKNEQNGCYELLRGQDAAKDQSYMLYRLSQAQLGALHLPLANLEKTEIRRLAEEAGIMPQVPKDSQDICFLPNGDYAGFLTKEYGMKPKTGDFLLTDGTVIGKHSGQWQYTVGQRKGLGIACGYPVYVTAKDAAANTVTVGREEALFGTECVLRDCKWISMPQDSSALTAKVRYSRREAAVSVDGMGTESAVLHFAVPQRAMTLGQSAVIYEGERVIGGGLIAQVMK